MVDATEQKIEQDGLAAIRCLARDHSPYASSDVLETRGNFHLAVYIFNNICRFQESKLFAAPLKDLLDRKWYKYYLEHIDKDPKYLRKIERRYKEGVYSTEQRMLNEMERMYHNVVNFFGVDDHYGKIGQYRLQCLRKLKEDFIVDGNVHDTNAIPPLQPINPPRYVHNESSDVSSISTASVCPDMPRIYPNVVKPPLQPTKSKSIRKRAKSKTKKRKGNAVNSKVSKQIARKKRKLNESNIISKNNEERDQSNCNRAPMISGATSSSCHSAPQSFGSDRKNIIKLEQEIPKESQLQKFLKEHNFKSELFEELNRLQLTYADLMDDEVTTYSVIQSFCKITEREGDNNALALRLYRVIKNERKKELRKKRTAVLI